MAFHWHMAILLPQLALYVALVRLQQQDIAGPWHRATLLAADGYGAGT